jgi:hypothetical protein
LGHLADDLLGRNAAPATAAERAVHASVVLYAIHQQSRSEPMHMPGIGMRAISPRRFSMRMPHCWARHKCWNREIVPGSHSSWTGDANFTASRRPTTRLPLPQPTKEKPDEFVLCMPGS